MEYENMKQGIDTPSSSFHIKFLNYYKELT